LEINLTALAHNLQQYRQLLAPGVKMMVMVKAFGYGSGDAEIARLLQFNKVDWLAVAYTDEGLALRKAGIHLPVMVMNPEPESFASMEEHNLEPEIFSFEILSAFSSFCRHLGISQYPVHIKIDTGMHRLGFTLNEIDHLAKTLANQKLLLVKSVFTHLASSEMAEHDAFTQFPADQFLKACNTLQTGLGYSFTRHMANTAGIRRHADKHLDMVRLGIGLYGVDANMNLQVVTTLKTTVAQVKEIKAGETIGYNLKGKAEKDSRVATIRIGYADGFRRAMGNGKGSVWINGQPAPVIGNVSMDMTMVDVSETGNVRAGDVVEIFGTHIPVQQVANICDTIAYEILTGISQRVKRIYVQE
jgi:alanine racemase